MTDKFLEGTLDFIIRKTALEKKTETLVWYVVLALANERFQMAGIGGFIDVLQRGLDGAFGQLQGTQSSLDFESSPSLVFHLVMDVGMAETSVIQKVI